MRLFSRASHTICAADHRETDLMSKEELPSDEFWMEEALRAAQRAFEAGEVSVGAVVVCDGKIVVRGWNRNITACDSTAHAEIIALRAAGTAIGKRRRGDCRPYAT